MQKIYLLCFILTLSDNAKMSDLTSGIERLLGVYSEFDSSKGVKISFHVAVAVGVVFAETL